jgi:hypothetical protein
MHRHEQGFNFEEGTKIIIYEKSSQPEMIDAF